MMCSTRIILRPYLLGAAAACAVVVSSCDSSTTTASGTVTVDGTPLEIGTIHFRPIEGGDGRGVGGTIRHGEFSLPADQGLRPGKYTVTVEGFKETKRMVMDPQRGQVRESVQLRLKDSPKELEISNRNASDLTLQFVTTSSR